MQDFINKKLTDIEKKLYAFSPKFIPLFKPILEYDYGKNISDYFDNQKITIWYEKSKVKTLLFEVYYDMYDIYFRLIDKNFSWVWGRDFFIPTDHKELEKDFLGLPKDLKNLLDTPEEKFVDEYSDCLDKIFIQWFSDCWDKAWGLDLKIPAYIQYHDTYDYFDLKNKKWVELEI